ncbi:MAG: hypothetical protein ACJ8AT_30975 [Hyalangium sp.]
MLLFCALPPRAEAQTQKKTQKKTQGKAKSHSKTQGKTKPSEQVKTPEPQNAPAQEAPKTQEPEKAQVPDKALTQDKPLTPAKAPLQPKAQIPPKPPEKVLPQSVVQEQERAEARSQLRIGVALDLFAERATMSGTQTINTSPRDESFDYSSATFLSATLSMSVPAPIAKDRARIGGAVRLFGNYSADGDHPFGFGLFNQAFVTGEYGLPVADRLEAVFGGRVGLSLLIPGHEMSAEIHRLQDQGVDVLSVPRVGWLGGLSAGARRRMSDHILLRADLSGQLEKLYLFATSEDLGGLHFDKHWSTLGLRLGLTLGVEFAL